MPEKAWRRSVSVLLVFGFLAFATGCGFRGGGNRSYMPGMVGAWGNSTYTFHFRIDGTMSYTFNMAGQEDTKTGTYEVLGVEAWGPPQVRRQPGFYRLRVSFVITDSDKLNQMAIIDFPDKDTLRIWPALDTRGIPFRPAGMAPDDNRSIVLTKK